MVLVFAPPRFLERGYAPREDGKMDERQFESKRRFVETPSGRISYVQHGSGPAALFVHGVLLNGYLWRHQLAALADVRTCIALDTSGARSR